jgi:TPR repeat protein
LVFYFLIKGLYGMCLVHGDGIKMDKKKGLELIRFSAEKNNIKSQFHLGILYKDGVLNNNIPNYIEGFF